uniref:BTB domain-containing protein n=1 Tax=Plectus sambesii TaxID=2011161 RepID=A0A914WPS8_9BILA
MARNRNGSLVGYSVQLPEKHSVDYVLRNGELKLPEEKLICCDYSASYPLTSPQMDDENNEDFHLLLNMGGSSFRLRNVTVQYRCPDSFLGQFARMSHEDRVARCDGYLELTHEYYFERTARMFEMIFDFISTGHLHRPSDLCPDRLMMELDYWKIPRHFFAPCCAPCDSSAGDEDNQQIDQSLPIESGLFKGDEFDGLCCAADRRAIWQLVEEPSSSLSAKCFAIISIAMVITSVGGLILGSLPELQNHKNVTAFSLSLSANRTDLESEPILALQYAEFVCIVWFTFEFTLRFFICAHKCSFMREALNVIDVLTIVPFYAELGLQIAGISASSMREFKALVLVMRIVRVMRVARVFKLARYSSGLKSFGTTVKTSLPELSMLGLFLVTAIIFFSTLMYFAEKDEANSQFKSIPDACWWCVITMTTVGYGDITPKTLFGKVIASFASISGVLVLAFPITMIVENFSKTYESTDKKDFKAVRRHRRMGRAF